MLIANLAFAVLSALPGFTRTGTDELFPAAARVNWEIRDGRFHFSAETEMPREGVLKRVGRRPSGPSPYAFIDDFYAFGFPRRFLVNARGATTTEVAGLETESVETNGLWRFSLSVPLESVGGLPADGRLRVMRNFARAEKDLGGRTYAVLNVADRGEPTVSGFELGKGTQEGFYPVRIAVRNPDSRKRSLALSFAGKPVNSQPCEIRKSFALAPGEERLFEAKGAVLDDEKVGWTLALKEGGRTLVSESGSFVPNFPGRVFIRPPDESERVSFRLAYFPSFNRMRVRIDASQLEDRAGSSVAVVAKGSSRKIAEWSPVFDADGITDETHEIPDLRPETVRNASPDYEVVFRTAAGLEIRRAFKRFAMEWEGNKIGLSGVIPRPFEPIRREQGTGNREQEVVKVVLREHAVDKTTGLWKQVTAAGKDLLAGPIRLVSTSKTCSLFPDPCSLSMESTWDVDGMMDWRLTLKPGHYEPFSLVVPMKEPEARLMHSCVDGLRANYGGVVPAGSGRVWDGSKCRGRIGLLNGYVPYLWVGGSLRGISVFGDNDRGWVLEDRPGKSVPHHEIVREPGVVKIVLNLVQRPVDITEPRTIRIGFQATPVKPMPENWRSRSIGKLIGATKYWGGLEGVATSDETDLFLRKFAEARRTGKVDKAFLADYLEHHVPFRGVPGSSDYIRDRENLRIHQEAGMGWAAASAKNPDQKFVFYTNARGVEYGNESGLTYMDEWSRIEWKDRDVGRRELREYELDPVASYRDYAAFWYRKIFATGAANALYWDDVYAAPNFDLVGTDAYRLPDGRIQPSVGIFNMRALVRRCAVTQAELGRDPRDNWVHMTNTELAPVCAFAGVNYDWEDIYGNKPFQERYPRDMIVACSIGRQMGNRVSVMGYFAEKDPKSPLLQRLERGGTGVCLAYELDWSRVAAWNAANRLLEDWGYRRPDTRVWNYWDEDVRFPVEVSGGEAATLAMSREGRALVIISDWGGGGEFAVRPDCGTLGIRPTFAAKDLETGKEIPVADGVARVRPGKHDYVIMEMK